MLETILAWVVDAHPIWYFLLLIAAGSGLAVSEDALAIWAGGLIGRGEGAYAAEYYVVALYCGVVASDCWTFYLGRLAERAGGGKLMAKAFRNPEKFEKAKERIRKYGDKIGFVQRFSVGARWGIAFISGFSGISGIKFATGTALGALITLPLQLYCGYLMRNQIWQVIEIIGRYGVWVAVAILVLFAGYAWCRFRGEQRLG